MVLRHTRCITVYTHAAVVTRNGVFLFSLNILTSRRSSVKTTTILIRNQILRPCETPQGFELDFLFPKFWISRGTKKYFVFQLRIFPKKYFSIRLKLWIFIIFFFLLCKHYLQFLFKFFLIVSSFVLYGVRIEKLRHLEQYLTIISSGGYSIADKKKKKIEKLDNIL